MTLKIKEGTSINITDNLPISRYLDIACSEMDYMRIQFKNRYFSLMDDANIKNKTDIRKFIGGIKKYVIVEYERDEFNMNEYSSEIINGLNNTMANAVVIGTENMLASDDIPSSNIWMIDKKQYLIDALIDVGRLTSCLSKTSDKELVLKTLKAKYDYIDEVSKMRNLPKMSRILRIICDGVKSTHKIDYSNETLIAKLSDMLSRKPQEYILEISTDARDILTASVSDNFTSCYDIKRNACNCASVNYLALDNSTAIVKVYKLTKESVECLRTGIMPYKDCVARRLVNFTFDSQGNIGTISVNRPYPNYDILSNRSMISILGKLFNITCKWEKANDYARYGRNFAGYKDIHGSGSLLIGYQDAEFIPSLGNCGCLCYIPQTKDFEIRTDVKLRSNSLYVVDTDEDRRDEVDLPL